MFLEKAGVPGFAVVSFARTAWNTGLDGSSRFAFTQASSIIVLMMIGPPFTASICWSANEPVNCPDIQTSSPPSRYFGAMASCGFTTLG